MTPHEDQIRKLIENIVLTHQDDVMDCETCNSQLECLAEKVAMGAALRDLLPEVEAHFRCCRDCYEEFQALVCILRAEINGALSSPEYPQTES